MAKRTPPLPPVVPDDPNEYGRPTKYGSDVEATTGPRDVAKFLGPPSIAHERPGG